MLAMEPGLYGTGLERGHVLTHPEPLWPETPMHSFLILGSSPNVLPSIEVSGDLHVEFLQTAPVFSVGSQIHSGKRVRGLNASLERRRRGLLESISITKSTRVIVLSRGKKVLSGESSWQTKVGIRLIYLLFAWH